MIVFVSSHVDHTVDAVLEANGFETVTVAELLMSATRAPLPVATGFHIEPAADTAAVAAGLLLTSEANTVDRALLERTIRHAADTGAAQMWLAAFQQLIRAAVAANAAACAQRAAKKK